MTEIKMDIDQFLFAVAGMEEGAKGIMETTFTSDTLVKLEGMSEMNEVLRAGNETRKTLQELLLKDTTCLKAVSYTWGREDISLAEAFRQVGKTEEA